MHSKWMDVTLAKYEQCRVLSYTGGSTWLGTPWGVFLVIPDAPVQIRRQLEAGSTIRAEVLPISAETRTAKLTAQRLARERAARIRAAKLS
jgi:hypothetical protein